MHCNYDAVGLVPDVANSILPQQIAGQAASYRQRRDDDRFHQNSNRAKFKQGLSNPVLITETSEFPLKTATPRATQEEAERKKLF